LTGAHINILREVLVEEIVALVKLTEIPLLGSIKIRLLLERFGSAVESLKADPQEVMELPGFTPKVMQGWETGSPRTLELVERLNLEVVPFTSQKYPKRLLELPDHPIILYMKGELKNTDQNSLAVVGTRQATLYGKEMAEKISQELALAGITVVSGLARGIDTEAHKGALKSGRTIAVIGSGLANIYPQENSQLAEEIAANGVLISEFPPNTPPDRQNFPQRNRIVSGMTLGTVLIEAPVKSGAMLTMQRAKGQGRKLFALPGRVDGENFKGNHQLIKSGEAELIENASDILNSFNGLFSFKPHSPTKVMPQLEQEEQQLISLLPSEELTIGEIIKLTNLPVTKLNILLMSLILKKVIREYPGKIYKRVME
jgi:DNA processing protein